MAATPLLSDDASSPVRQPSLKELHDGGASLQSIGEFTLNVLAEHGWASVDTANIRVENTSGGGAAATYKISCPGASPECVMLHESKLGPVVEPVRKPRMEAAQRLLVDHGLAPRRLAQGGDWFIEEWCGDQIGEPGVLWGATAAECGVLLAKVHALPTGWFDETRTALKERYPILRPVPDASTIWSYASNYALLLDGFTDDQIQFWASANPELSSQYAKRVVTNHADLHPANMIRGPDGAIRLIDFESTCVSCAVKDVAYFFMASSLWKSAEARSEFVEAYLSNVAGASPDSEEVDKFLFDCQAWGTMISLVKAMFSHKGQPISKMGSGLRAYKKANQLLERARATPKLRQKVLQKGLLVMLGMHPMQPTLLDEIMPRAVFGIFPLALVIPIATIAVLAWFLCTASSETLLGPQAMDMGSKGMTSALVLPLLGSAFGVCHVYFNWKKAQGATKEFIVLVFFLALKVIYGIIGALLINAFNSGNASFAAGLTVGLSCFASAIGLSVFGGKAVHYIAKQQRLFVGIVIVVLSLGFFSLYGCIVALVIVTKSINSHVDLSLGAAGRIASCTVLANIGGLIPTVVASSTAMQLAVERPDQLARNVWFLVPANLLGLYGMIGAINPNGAYIGLGASCLTGGIVLAVLCLKAIRSGPGEDNIFAIYSCYVLGLVFVVLVIGLVIGYWWL